jgi:hypothetical protein
MPAYGQKRTKEVFLAEAQRRRGKLVSFCRVGIAHRRYTSIGLGRSGNARPALLQAYKCFSLRLCVFARVYPVVSNFPLRLNCSHPIPGSHRQFMFELIHIEPWPFLPDSLSSRSRGTVTLVGFTHFGCIFSSLQMSASLHQVNDAFGQD